MTYRRARAPPWLCRGRLNGGMQRARYDDEDPAAGSHRPPVREDALRAALIRPGSLWRDVRVVAETGSTNADLAARAAAGTPEGAVLVAEAQRAGRGRLGRGWTAPPRTSLTFSMLLRPAVEASRWSWLPLLTGVAVAAAAGRYVDARLKWPNDVLVGPRKLAGILAERARDAVVVGVGLNVAQTAEELPVHTATSLALEGAGEVDRAALLGAVLRGVEDRYAAWRSVAGDPERSGTAESYRRRCATLGRTVRVELPAGEALVGEACGVDEAGRLVVRTAGGERAVSAGDVVHVR